MILSAALLAGVPAKGEESVSSEAQAGRFERPLIALVCPETTGQGAAIPPGDAEALCQWLQQRLARLAPESAFRRVTSFEDAPARPGDIAVALNVVRIDDRGLTGYLEWRTMAGEAPVAGPPTTLSVSDTQLTPAMFGQFIDALLQNSSLPLKE